MYTQVGASLHLTQSPALPHSHAQGTNVHVNLERSQAAPDAGQRGARRGRRHTNHSTRPTPSPVHAGLPPEHTSMRRNRRSRQGTVADASPSLACNLMQSPARTKHTRPHLRAQGRDGTHICTPDHLLTFITTSPRPSVDFASERNHVELVQEVVGDEDEVEREENQADALGKAEAREERDQIDSDKRADEDDR